MANVVIDDKHLKDIGNALRIHLGDMQSEKSLIVDSVTDHVYKTDNYDSDGNFIGGALSHRDYHFELVFPGAVYVYYRAVGTVGTNARIAINNSHHMENFGLYGTGLQMLSVNYMDCTVHLYDEEVPSENVGFCFTALYGVDADGNKVPGSLYDYKHNLFKPREMADSILDLATIPSSAFNVTGSCNYKFAGGGWDWFIDQYGDQITTSNITNASFMFNGSNVAHIPFDLDVKANKITEMFCGCKIEEAPHIDLKLEHTSTKFDMQNLFMNCYYLRDVENAFDGAQLEQCLSTFKITSEYAAGQWNAMFQSCYSLRKTPSWLKNIKLNAASSSYPAYSYHPYYNIFNNNYVLDEILDFPVITLSSKTATTNYFYYSFQNCYRIKDCIFETNSDGTPIVANWSNQVIDLGTGVGYSSSFNASNITSYNTGITTDDAVNNTNDYAAKKNSENWYSVSPELSRYNHDSAVNTINSLPDCSAAGSNTIKFKGNSGSLTDGGAINTLTEAEIAVAAAKGWTVSLA